MTSAKWPKSNSGLRHILAAAGVTKAPILDWFRAT